MNWDAVEALAELAVALGVILTLGYLAVQIRQNSKLLAASAADSSRDAYNESSCPPPPCYEEAERAGQQGDEADVEWLGAIDRGTVLHQPFQARLSRRRYSTPLIADPLGGAAWLFRAK